MTAELVPAVSARRRARAGLALALVTCTALSVFAGHSVTPGLGQEEWTGPTLIVAALILFLLPFLHQGGRARLHEPGQRYLTAWTITGWRTIDLHQLTRIWRYQLPSKGRPVDMLVLTDSSGVRLMIDNREVNRAVTRALSDHPNDTIRISRSAQHRLGLVKATLGLQVWWFVRTFFGFFVLLLMCFALPLLVTGVASAVFTM